MNVTKNKLKVTCIFHKGCMDGWMSALPIWHAYHETAEMKFIPAHYGDEPPAYDGEDFIFVVDFSYKPEVIEKWETGKAEVFIIDHHTKAIQALVDHPALNLQPGPEIGKGKVYDSKARYLTAYLAFNDGKPHKCQASGAGLVREFLENYRGSLSIGELSGTAWEEITSTGKVSQSYDLWHHGGEEKHVNTYLSMFFKEWERSNRDKFNTMQASPEQSHALMLELVQSWAAESLDSKLSIGEAATAEHGKQCRGLCETAYEVKLPVVGYDKVKIGFIPGENLKVSVSTLGSIAVREYGWDVMVMIAAVKDNCYILTLRSNESGTNVDVSDICDQIGKGPFGLTGGGHRNAAGCTIRRGDLQEVVSKVLSL